MRGVNKRGSSHLEIIISFVLFVGFALFLMAYLQPTQQNTLQDSILLGMKNKFFDNIMTNVTIAFVKKGDNYTQWSTCSSLPICKPIEVSGDYSVNVSIPSTCFYYVYVSREFSPNGLSNCTTSNYTIGFVEVQIVYSNKSLYDINNRYYNDYDGLKSVLGVPASVDFSISTSSPLATYSMTRQTPDDADVIAGTYREPVLYSNGTIINQDFVVKIW